MERFKAYKLTETPDRKIRAEFVDYTLDQLDPGDVTVRVAYSSVNYKDALAATGKGRILRRASCIGGIDFSGTVVSSTDPRFKKGDAVLTTSGEYVGVSHDGGYSPYARVKGDWITKLAPGLSLWEAMAYGTAGYTAGIAMVRMEHEGLKPANGPVIVNGATGGVGSIVLSMFAKLGYHTVALPRTGRDTDWFKRQGESPGRRRSDGLTAPMSTDLAQKCVLVVDDSRFVRTTFASILRSSFTVREAADGEDAWAAIDADPSIVLVLTDLDMPKLTGFALIARIRNSTNERVRELPVVVISGNEEPGSKERARDAGATDFIAKSADGTEVLSRLNNVLRLVATTKELDSAKRALDQSATHDPATGTVTPHYMAVKGRK